MKIFKGPILTCDRHGTVLSYLVEHEGRIVYTGDTLPDRYPDTDIIDLGQKALIPAFGDSHLHFLSYALFSATLDVRDAEDFDGLSDLLSNYIRDTGAKVVLGFGISAHHVHEKRMITLPELDRIENKRPVMLVKYDGHAAVMNTAMRQMLPPKIKKLRGYNAQTGLLYQEAFFMAADHLTSKMSVISLIKQMLSAVDAMASKGIGLIHPAEGVGFPLDLDVDLVRFLARGLSNPFHIRPFFQTMDIKKVKKRKLPRVGGCFATALDGCFGSVDAALKAPYKNAPDNKGILFYPDAQVTDFVCKAHDNGLQVQMHAIGDAAFDQAVNAIVAAIKSNYRTDCRHGIIHGSLATAEGLDKCAEYNIGIAAQPGLLDLNLEPFSYLNEILGARAYDISPFRRMVDMGIHVSGGSDAPVTSPDPISAIHAACNHFNPSQSVTVMEALKMFTYEPARASFDEKDRGSLETGKLADMVVLDRNPLDMKAEEIRSLTTETLYLAGTPYKKGQTLPNLLWRALFKRSAGE